MQGKLIKGLNAIAEFINEMDLNVLVLCCGKVCKQFIYKLA